ncbi:MAG: ABC transporter permease, partial [Paracoccaceae bacterium]
MRFERREDVSLPALFIAPFAAIAVTLVLCAGLIAMAGVNPLTAYAEMLKGAFGSRLSVTETLTRAVPLMLTGLAAAVAFRARLWNIGGEGQFYIGALVAAGLGHDLVSGLPVPLAIAVLMLASMAAGAALLVGPALMRLRFGIDEVVTTLLLNFIVLLFVGLMVEGPLKDPMAFGWPQSVPVASGLRLPDLVPRSRLHVGLILALVVAALVWLLQARTVFGARTRAAGLNP